MITPNQDPIRAFTGPLDTDTARVLAIVACLRHGVAYREMGQHRGAWFSDSMGLYLVAAIHDRDRLVERVRKARYPLGVHMPACSWLEAVTAVVMADVGQWCVRGGERVLRDLLLSAATNPVGTESDDSMVRYFLGCMGTHGARRTRPWTRVTQTSILRVIVTDTAPAVRMDLYEQCAHTAVAEYLAREHPGWFVAGVDLHFDLAFDDYVAAGGCFEVDPREVGDVPRVIDAALRVVAAETVGVVPGRGVVRPLERDTELTRHIAAPPWPTETVITYDAVLTGTGADVLLRRVSELAEPYI